MTDPQPLSPQDIELVEMMLKDSGLVRSGPSIVAILRDYQRVLAENEHLRHSAEILNDEVLLGIDKVATIALLQEYGGALNAGKPYPGTGGGLLLNAADMMVNLAQHLKRERAEKQRLVEAGRFKRNAVLHDCRCVTGTWVAVPEEDFAVFRAAIDAARSGGEGEG